MNNIIFKELNVSKEILKAVEKMGFEEATPIQSQSIPPILEGHDVIAQAPTGTGKTCAFGIPMIEGIDTKNEQVQAVVLCPTRELTIQITEELQKVAEFKKGIKITPIYGGQQIERQITALKKRPQIIIATPGRMMDHLRRKTIKIDHLRLLVLDEADEMLNMGFREDIDTILETVPQEKQTILFSATLSSEIMEIAHTYQKEDAIIIKITHKEITVPTIEQYYIEVKGKKKDDVLARLIDTNQFRLSLVFCNTKRMVDDLTKDLVSRGYQAEALHGDMKQVQRDRVMNRFRKGVVDILVATDVAARGIDVDEIDAVFNYDIPSDVEYYVHRIGRTGRAKRLGVSYTFASGKEMYKLKDIMKYTKSTIKPFKAPSDSDVFELRTKKTLEKVKYVIENGNLSKYVNMIENFSEELDDVTTLDIAAALLQLTSGDDKGEFQGDSNQVSYQSGAEKGMARIFINVGSLDKIKPRHMVEILASNSSLEGKLVGAIDIYDKFSFVEVPYEYVKEVTENVTGTKYKGRNVVAQLANNKK